MASIKGSNVIPLVQGLRKMKAKSQAILPPSLHHYLEERVLPSSWYPEKDALELMRAFIEVLEPPGDSWAFMGQSAAFIHATGQYAHMFASRDVESIVRKADILWRSYHDTGTIETNIEGPGTARLELSGFEALTRHWYKLLAGYYHGVLQAAGAKNPEVRPLGYRIDDTDRCAWRLTWSVDLQS